MSQKILKRSRIVVLGIASLLIAQWTLAEDFWLKKDYSQWTKDETHKILTDSPWAKAVTVALGATGPNPAAAGDDATDRRRLNEGSQGAANANTDLVISWQSALPLKEALLRNQLLSGDKSADPQKTLVPSEKQYVVLVSGIPARVGRTAQDDAINKCSIKIDKKDPLVPLGANVVQRGQTIDVYIAFPRDKPIVLEDNEVEVNLKIGTIDAKKKFKVKDMMFNGKLEM